MPKEDIGRAGRVGLPSSMEVRRADDDIGKAVAVDVAGRGDRAAEEIVGRGAVDAEAVVAVKSRKVGVKRTGMAEHHEAPTPSSARPLHWR